MPPVRMVKANVQSRPARARASSAGAGERASFHVIEQGGSRHHVLPAFPTPLKPGGQMRVAQAGFAQWRSTCAAGRAIPAEVSLYTALHTDLVGVLDAHVIAVVVMIGALMLSRKPW